MHNWALRWNVSLQWLLLLSHAALLLQLKTCVWARYSAANYYYNSFGTLFCFVLAANEAKVFAIYTALITAAPVEQQTHCVMMRGRTMLNHRMQPPCRKEWFPLPAKEKGKCIECMGTDSPAERIRDTPASLVLDSQRRGNASATTHSISCLLVGQRRPLSCNHSTGSVFGQFLDGGQWLLPGHFAAPKSRQFCRTKQTV